MDKDVYIRTARIDLWICMLFKFFQVSRRTIVMSNLSSKIDKQTIPLYVSCIKHLIYLHNICFEGVLKLMIKFTTIIILSPTSTHLQLWIIRRFKNYIFSLFFSIMFNKHFYFSNSNSFFNTFHVVSCTKWNRMENLLRTFTFQ